MSELKEIREKILVNVKEVAEKNEEKLIEAYKRVMKFEHIARKEGLLALEYEAEFIPKETPLCNEITEMIELIVSGTEPQIFEELMTIKFFVTHDYNEIEALLYFLYARSILMIQAATSPRWIEALFNSVIPNAQVTFDKAQIMWEEERKNKIKEWLNALTVKEKDLLCDMSVKLQELSEEEWNIAISNEGFYGFDKILPYLNEETKALVKNYMNDYRYYVIMNSPRAVTEPELTELNEELGEVISRLRNKDKTNGILDVILKCNDKEIQLLLRYVDNNTLAIALKGVKKEVANCFWRNMSLRLQHIVKEDMDSIGPLRMCDVEAEQRKIMKILYGIKEDL